MLRPAASSRPPVKTEKRVDEAVAAGAEIIAVGCNGCFALTKKAAERNLDVFHVVELIQTAIGEEPPHRIRGEMDQTMSNFVQTVSENPDLLKKRYHIENGKLMEC